LIRKYAFVKVGTYESELMDNYITIENMQAALTIEQETHVCGFENTCITSQHYLVQIDDLHQNFLNLNTDNNTQ